MMALDHLGVIAARIRTAILKYQTKNDQKEAKTWCLEPMDEVNSPCIVLQVLTVDVLDLKQSGCEGI